MKKFKIPTEVKLISLFVAVILIMIFVKVIIL